MKQQLYCVDVFLLVFEQFPHWEGFDLIELKGFGWVMVVLVNALAVPELQDVCVFSFAVASVYHNVFQIIQ